MKPTFKESIKRYEYLKAKKADAEGMHGYYLEELTKEETTASRREYLNERVKEKEEEAHLLGIWIRELENSEVTPCLDFIGL